MKATPKELLLKIARRMLKPEALQKALAFASLIILWLFFAIFVPGFAGSDNTVTIMLQSATIGVLGIGVTFVIISGGIDLSIGSVMAFSMMMTGVFISFVGMPVAIGVILGVLVGGACGLINGTLVSRLKIPAFIATLGMMMVARGMALIVSDTKPIYLQSEGFYGIAMGSVGSIFGTEIPNAVIVFILAAVAASLVLNKTVLGLYTFALGSNEEAARLSGIRVRMWKTIIYGIGGLFCGLAGMLMASRLGSAQPAEGQGYELEAIAAVVIGGTSLSGGEGSILGTVIGALLLKVLTNGLTFMEVSQQWQLVVVGVIVIASVYADNVRRSRKKK